jgi:hypothetical protein
MKDRRLVKIKTWDRMVKEFGLDNYGNINCENEFLINMEEELPKNRIIVIERDITEKGRNYLWPTNDLVNGWTITEDMIEEELDPKDYPQYFI